jgi:hypothetical protein
MSKSLGVVAGLGVLFALAGQAKADQLTTFHATGSFSDGSNLSGTITVDNTTQGVVAESLVLSGPSGTWSFPGFGPAATTELIYSPTAPFGLGITQIWTAVATSPTSFVGIDLVLPGETALASSSAIPLVPFSSFLGPDGPYRSGTSFLGVLDIPSLPPPALQDIGAQPDFAVGKLMSGELDPTPEPASLTLLGTGIVALGAYRLRRRPSRPDVAS